MNKKQKHSIIAGGAGFIGSHLCERLLHDGYRVTCIDNLSTGRLENIHHLLCHDSFKFVRHDITDQIPDNLLSNDRDIDFVFNLACQASPLHYQRDPVKTLLTSVNGSYNLLEVARATGAGILLASTSEVYGDPTVSPQNESYRGNVNTTGPRSCYDEGKRAAESLFSDYNRVHGTDTRIIRIFNTYGPRMDYADGRAIPNFTVQALLKKPLTVNGDGTQTRSFMYIDDLIDALVKMMSPGIPHYPINIGNPHEITIRYLAETIKAMTESPSEINYRALPQDDPLIRCPDISLANRILNWKPRIPLDKGLQSTISYFKSILNPSKYIN